MKPARSILARGVRSTLGGLGLLLLLTSCAVAHSVGKEQCPEEFDCVMVEAPLDHLDPSLDTTVEVVFAVRPADGVRRGVLVTAVGGPGASGLESATYEPSSMDPSILESFDLVYFDQRGLRSFAEPACPSADGRWGEGYDELPVDDPSRWDGLVELSRVYNESCIAESGGSDLIPHLGTEQVARDLELFRTRQGYDTLVIYGQSYGTAVAQVYAELFPDRVDRLILDGPLERTRDSLQQNEDQIDGLETVTDLLFEACDADAVCSEDMGGSALEAYKTVIADLLEEPVTVRFPISPDKFDDWPLLAEDITYLAFANSYFEGDRMLYLRALAAATRGDYVPMLRLYSASGFGLSSMVNLSVTCLDGSIPGTDTAGELEMMTEARLMVDPELRWVHEFSLPCLTWPGLDHASEAPSPFAGGDVPTMIIVAEADAATPRGPAMAMLDQFQNAHLLAVNGGSHVMFGRGVACVDESVTSFILGGQTPRETTCEAPIVDPYVPLIDFDAEKEMLLEGVDNELTYLPELFYWDGYSFTEVACAHGGGVSFTGTDFTTDFTLDDCAFSADLVVSGEGRWDYQHGRTEMTVTFEGDACTYDFSQVWGNPKGHVEPDCP